MFCAALNFAADLDWCAVRRTLPATDSPCKRHFSAFVWQANGNSTHTQPRRNHRLLPRSTRNSLRGAKNYEGGS